MQPMTCSRCFAKSSLRANDVSERVTFRESALNDLRRHDQWRLSLEPPAPPIRSEVVVAIIEKLGPFRGFNDLPYPVVSVQGEVLPIKRCLIDVRSKRFVVFVARGADGQPEVARIRHPRQQPLF